jgi:DNA polymerase-3 subunit beta
MKFTCLQENLKDGLSIVSKAVATRGSLPVLSNVLLATEEGGRLKLAATNLETSIITWVKANVEKPGAITVPARLLQEFVGNLPATEITVELQDQNLLINAPSGKSKFNGMPQDEFPSLPKVAENLVLEVDPAAFAKAVSEVVFTAAADESRPVLSGVLLKTSGKDLVLVGVDGFRLAERRLPLSEELELLGVLVPSKTLSEVARLVSGSASRLKIAIQPEGNLASFTSDNFSILSRLLEGEFPDYGRIIPVESKTKASFSKDDFLKAVRLSNTFSKDANNIIKVIVNSADSQITLTATASEIGESVSHLPAQITGEDLEASFNGKFLLDLLNNTASEKLALEASGPLSPGLWRLDDRADYLHLVMPVRVTG